MEYFLEANTWKDMELKAKENDNLIWDGKRESFKDTAMINVLHDDGSSFSIKHAHYRFGCVNKNLECLIVYPEHNSVMVFPIGDLTYAIAIYFDRVETIVNPVKNIL